MADKKYSPLEAAIAVLNKAKELYSASSLSKSEDLKKGEWKHIHDKLEKEGYSKKSADKIDGAIKAKMNKGENDSERGVHSAVSSQKWGHGTSHAGSDAISATASMRRAKNGESPSPTRSMMSADKAKERAVSQHQKVLGEMKGMSGKDKSGMGKSEDAGSDMAMSEENPDEKADAELGEHVEREVEAHEEGNEDPKHKMKGHIKLAKFMGRMEHKKGQKAKEMEKAETGHEKGINRQSVSNTNPGVSEAEGRIRTGNKYGSDMASSKQHAMGDAKDIHREKLDQIHQMSKPKLPG